MIRRTSGGFTLVEMLVAVSLMGLLGIISWRGLDHVLDQRARINQQDAQVARLVRAIAQIERDLDQRVAEALLVAPAGPSNALPGSMTVAADEGTRQRLSILRRHPDGAGTLRTSYQLDEGELVRLSVSRESTQPDSVLLMEDVAVFGTRFLSPGGWKEVRELQDVRALAIEISIERNSGERYTKIVPL
jgi:general secretion pathway protein J